MRVKAVIFDLIGVLVDSCLKDEKTRRELAKFLKRDPKLVNLAWKLYWPSLRIGKISEREFWELFLGCVGSKKNVKDVMRFVRKDLRLRKATLELAKKLKERKLKLAILTNNAREWVEYERKAFELERYFDLILNSGELGIAKPDPRIYKLATKLLKCKASECVFIDDKKRNVEFASLVGMHAIQFRSAKQLVRELRKLGLKL